ncbi:hypothetical protein KAU04_07535, partial [bacterium]|nr:hypothetical protein [bacterium]
AIALDAHDVAFDCCANEAVIDGSVQFSDYDAVIWVLGDEDSTFTPAEQSLVTVYLEGGGSLFLSGSEVGYDLAEMGSADDLEFYNQILQADYLADDAGVNSAQGVSGTIFAGLDIAFDDGTHGIYPENSPDAIAPWGNSVVNLTYQGFSLGAGVEYQGTFGSGSQEGRLVYLTFPFETIYPESARTAVMGRVLGFFGLTTPVEPGMADDSSLPGEFVLYQNYPNPFNPPTTIAFTLPGHGARHTTLRIYNILGQRMRMLLDARLQPGCHIATWDGRDDSGQPVSSGVYFYSLRAGSLASRRKMVLLR